MERDYLLLKPASASRPSGGCGDDGVPSFDRVRYRRHDASVFLYAFDLIEWNGDDLRQIHLRRAHAQLWCRLFLLNAMLGLKPPSDAD